MDENSTNNIAKELRRKAEEKLENKELKSVKQLSLPEIEKLVHELEVHQIELELMNEELMLANTIAETANEKYVELYDFAPTGYFTLTAVGDINALNLSGAKMLGNDRSYLINTRFGLFVSDECKPSYNKFLEKTFKNNTAETCEITLNIADKLPVYLHLTAIADPNKEQCFVDAVDITKRKQAEEKIKESEEKYYNLFNNSEVGMFRTLLDGSEILDFNQKYLSILKYTFEEVNGKPSKNLWANKAERDKMVEILKVEGRINDFECDIIDKNGEIKRCLTSLKLYKEEGILEGSIIDITERKHAEEKLKESEEKYRLMVENSGLGVGVYSLDGTILYFNQKALENLGGKPEDYNGKSLIECFGEKSGNEYIKRYKEAINSDATLEFEDYLDTPNGKKWFYSNQTVIKDANGNIRGVQVLAKDITDRKLAEQKIIESEDSYHTLFDSVNDALFVSELQEDGLATKFIKVNKVACQRLGYTEAELLTMSTNDISSNNVKPKLPVIISNIIDKDNSIIESEHITKEGKVIAVEISTRICKIKDKVYFYSIARDISERKQAEENIKESEEKYRELVENSPDAIAIYEEGKLLFVNNELVRLLAAKNKEELIGMPVLQFIHPDSKELVVERMKKVAIDNTTLPFVEEKALRLDGKAVNVDIKAIPVKLGGKNAVQLIIHDLTEKKQTDLALQNANRLYSVLSNVNQAIFQIKDKLEIYKEVCRIVIEDGHFRMAWIGEIDEQINKIVPVVSAGYVNGYLDAVNIDLTDEKRSGGPTGRAAKTGEHYIAYDIANSPDMALWKESALQNGYFTSAAFPIKIFNKVIGAFTLYADASYSFNAEEINLLDLLAKDISNGIEFYEVDTLRQETLEALKESEEIQSLYMKHSPIYTYIKEVTSKGSRVLKASDNFIEMIGVSSTDMIGKTMEELYPAEFAEKISQDDRDVVASGKMLEQEEELNGRVYITLKYPIIERGKRLLAGYTIDITNRKKAEEELKESMNNLQRFHKLTVGRELTMIELKKEVNALLKKTGQDEKYKIVE